jgi:hypothetical protein
MSTIVDVREAAKHYIDGKRVRRYITDEIHAKARAKAHSEGKHFKLENSWKGVWLWLDKDGKRCSNTNQAISYKDWQNLSDEDYFSRVFSPLESIEKLGFGNETDKLWEIDI